MDDNAKKLIEEVKDSKYFDLLLEEKIRTKSIELIKRRKWVLSFFVLINLVIVLLFGIKIIDFNNEIKKLESKAQNADSLIQKYEFMIENFEETQKALSIVNKYEKQFINMEKEIIAEKTSFNNEARKTLQDMLSQLTNLEVEKQFEELNNIAAKTKIYLDTLKAYRDSIDPKIDALSSISKEIKKSSSVRYLFIERGDKLKNGDEYRPAEILLPYSKDTLTATFHKVEKKNNPKKILVDIYLNNNKILFEDLGFSDLYRLNKQLNTKFKSTEGNEYKIDPVFIYLPPNPLLTSRIPDYVILKIVLINI